MQPALNLKDQDILTPAEFESGPEVPLSCGTVLDPVQNPEIVAPGQFCNELLQNLRLRPRFSQRTHIAEVARTEALDSRKLGLQIVSQALHFSVTNRWLRSRPIDQ